jgi:hypothetical protein
MIRGNGGTGGGDGGTNPGSGGGGGKGGFWDCENPVMARINIPPIKKIFNFFMLLIFDHGLDSINWKLHTISKKKPGPGRC